mgnify:CR=1 FL=1
MVRLERLEFETKGRIPKMAYTSIEESWFRTKASLKTCHMCNHVQSCKNVHAHVLCAHAWLYAGLCACA